MKRLHAAIALVLTASLVSGDVQIRRVAVTGESAPGMPGLLSGLTLQHVNEHGDLAVIGSVPQNGGDVTHENDQALYRVSDSGWEIVYREGWEIFRPDQFPPTYGAIGPATPSGAYIGNNGEMLVSLTYRSWPQPWIFATYRGGPSGLALLSGSGMVAPGTGGERWGWAPNPMFIGNGMAVFSNHFAGNPQNQGFWSNGDSGSAMIGGTGLSAPGVPGAVVASAGAAFGRGGHAVVSGSLQHDSDLDIDASNDDAIWYADSIDSNLRLVIRQGDELPGTNGGLASSLQASSPSAHGEFVLFAKSSGGQGFSGDGLWHFDGDSLQPVIFEGGRPEGTTGAVSLFRKWAVGRRGEVIFSAELGSRFRSGVFRWRDGVTTKIMENGDPAPGGNWTFDVSAGAVVNARGDVVLLAGTKDASGGSPAGGGLWSLPVASGQLKPMVHSDLPFDFNAGSHTPDFRTEFSWTAHETQGFRGWFTDSGLYAFSMYFPGSPSSDTGIYIADFPEVGEVPCNPGDLAQPYALLDLADVVAFSSGFVADSPDVDLAEPFGLLDLNDIVAFIEAFVAGCDF